MSSTKNIGRLKKGWLLSKSSWTILKLNKGLFVLSIIGMLTTFIACVAILGLSLAIRSGVYVSTDESTGSVGWEGLLLGAIIAIIATIIANFFAGAITIGALEQFKGNHLTVRECMRRAFKRWKPLVGFSLLTALVGYTLGQIAQRVPFGGKVLVWLGGAAWDIANFFAIPIIMTDTHQTKPLDATRRSVHTVKKVWGEGVAAQLSLAAIFVLGILSGLLAVFALGLLSSILVQSMWLFVVLAFLPIIWILALGILINVLQTIIKAAVYHYAVTGESPAHFNKQLLHQAFTPKKARKIFSS